MTIERARRLLKPLRMTIDREPHEGFVVRDRWGNYVASRLDADGAARKAIIHAYVDGSDDSPSWRAAARALKALGQDLIALPRIRIARRRRRQPR